MKWPLTKDPKNRRFLLGRSPSAHVHDRIPLTKSYKFDSDSGQVFTEGTISTQSFEERDWTRPRLLSRKPHSATHLVKGARSLQDTAIEVAIENLLDLDFEGVSRLPTKFVLRIWKLANERYHIPFSVWVIFSRVLRDEEDIPLNVLRFSYQIEAPRMNLSKYTQALNSPTFEFLTYISISTLFSIPELVKLSSVKNLGILEVVHNIRDKHQSSITDRLIRAWYQAVVDDGAFSVLRILKLWNHKELTQQSLNYVTSFPSLALFDVRGCTFDTGSRATGTVLGWSSTLDVGLLAFFDVQCVQRAVSMRTSVQADPRPIRRAPSKQLSDLDKVTRLARAEVAGFLTNADRPVSPPDRTPWRFWDQDNRFLERPSTSSSTGTIRVDIRDKRSHISYESEEWNFIPTSIFSRIGELRNDCDLIQADVRITDAGLVQNELISTVPMACLHLGPIHKPLNPLLPSNPIKTLYGNAYSKSSAPPSPYLTDDTPGEDMSQFPNYMPRGRPDPRNIAFFRIRTPRVNPGPLDIAVNTEATKAENGNPKGKKRPPSPLTMIENSARRVGIGRSRSTHIVPVLGDENELTVGMESPEMKRSSTFANFGKNSKFMKNKKQKLGDVLDSFK
ncbi:hypothetical protein VTL71DRAFT_11701 [Oculimacula yallundae]|uniref:Uncharacterized protein n=1 Tax=Oculimacula yallundae TaxID=86028 RepID=A0ABR4CRG4_9HELO